MVYRRLIEAVRRGPARQSEPLPGTVRNSAGGYAFPVDDWTRLDRFLLLGTESATYYASARALTREAAASVERCLAEDGRRAVRRIVEVSAAGRAPKNEPALFALAMAVGLGDDATRAAGLAALSRVARTGTHLFHFAEYVEAFRGWGRGLRRAVARWYTEADIERLTLQVIKYRQRDGWSHRDLLRLAHPVADVDDTARRAVFDWACRGRLHNALPEQIHGVMALAQADGPETAARLIREHRLPRETVPTELLISREVWQALLEDMPMTATIRNLGKLGSVGLLHAGSEASRQVVHRLSDAEALRRARVHPLAFLLALRTYQQGRGDRGKLTWTPDPAVLHALDGAFYASFANVAPTGRRLMLALDVSGSMGMGRVAGTALTPREAAAAMAMITAAVEPQHSIIGFTCAGADRWTPYWARTGLSPLPITPRMRLDEVVGATAGLPFGGTDCALPMLYALEQGLEVDAFVIYTDSETWAGKVHPVEALRQYRQRTGIAAKLIVVAMVSNGFSIADPQDGGMLDVVGFDTAVPSLMADFIAG